MEKPREAGTFPLPPNQQLMGSPETDNRCYQQHWNTSLKEKRSLGRVTELENLFSFHLLRAHKSELSVAVPFYFFLRFFFLFCISLKQSTLFM